MKSDETHNENERPENKVLFVPLEEIRNIEMVIDKLETTRQELQKVAEGMKPIEKTNNKS